jgi:hypothetical protein
VVTHLLDGSGSMNSVLDATIEGFNGYITELLCATRRLRIRGSHWSSSAPRMRLVHTAVPLGHVELLTRQTYRPRGGTPLFDAIGRTIKETAQRLDADPALAGARVLFAIQTDGEENASREYTTRQQIASLIGEYEASGWTFVYLGANQDAFAEGAALGIRAGNTANYSPGRTSALFRAHGAATRQFMSAPPSPDGYLASVDRASLVDDDEEEDESR